MLRTSNAQELVFENPSRASRGALPGLRSRFRCATAGGRGIGRSDTLQCVHISEYAFWPEGSESKSRDARGHIAGRAEPAGDDGHHREHRQRLRGFQDRWDAAVAGRTILSRCSSPGLKTRIMQCRSSRASNGRRRSARRVSGIPSRGTAALAALVHCEQLRRQPGYVPAGVPRESGRGVSLQRLGRFRYFALVIRRREEAAPPVRRGRFVPGNKDGGASGRMTTRARSAFTANASRAIRMCSAATPRAMARTGSPRTSSTTAPANRRRASGGGFPSRVCPAGVRAREAL